MGALALGRFVFLPFHRASLAKAGMPKQNGVTHLQVRARVGHRTLATAAQPLHSCLCWSAGDKQAAILSAVWWAQSCQLAVGGGLPCSPSLPALTSMVWGGCVAGWRLPRGGGLLCAEGALGCMGVLVVKWTPLLAATYTSRLRGSAALHSVAPLISVQWHAACGQLWHAAPINPATTHPSCTSHHQHPLQTNDPAGFTVVDVMAWGALGHAAAFYLLATHSLQVDRIPF